MLLISLWTCKQLLPDYLLIHINIVFLSTRRAFEWTLPMETSKENLICISISPLNAIYPIPITLLGMIIIWWRLQIPLYHHDMARGWRVAANILSKQSRTADRRRGITQYLFLGFRSRCSMQQIPSSIWDNPSYEDGNCNVWEPELTGSNFRWGMLNVYVFPSCVDLWK